MRIRRPSASPLAKIGTAVLLLIVIRSLSEVFRLEYVKGDSLTIAEIRPFIVGALGAAIALAVALIANWAAWPRLSAFLAGCAVVLLFVYKVFVIG